MPIEQSELPAGWREVPLKQIAEIRFSSVDKITRAGEHSVRLCNYTDVYNNDYIHPRMDFMRASATDGEIARFGLKAGDVIITKDSETPDDIGVPAVVDETTPDLVCGYHLALIRPDQDQVDPTFLCKQLGSNRILRYFGRCANGLTRYGLSTSAIENAPIRLRDPEFLRDLGRMLRVLDDAIARAEAVLIKQRMSRTGLLDSLMNPGASAPSGINDWRRCILGDLLESTEYGISSALVDRGSVPVLRMNNFAGGEAALKEIRFTRDFVTRQLLLRPGDVLFNRTNSYEHVGRTGIWREQIAGATFASYLVRLNPRPALLRNEYLNLLLNMRSSQIAMRRYATPAVSQVNINPTNLRLLPVAIPTALDVQDEVIRIATSSREAIVNAERELTKLKAIKSGVAANLLAGRVPVPEGELS